MTKNTPGHTHDAAEIRDEGTWQKFVGKAKSTWGDLTDDDMMKYEGKYDEAMGFLKEKYGSAVDRFQDWWEREKHS